MPLKKRKTVNMTVQVIAALFTITSFYVFYRIEKLRMCLILLVGSFVLSLVIYSVLQFPYGFGMALLVNSIIMIGFIVKWSRQWNRKLLESNLT